MHVNNFFKIKIYIFFFLLFHLIFCILLNINKLSNFFLLFLDLSEELLGLFLSDFTSNDLVVLYAFILKLFSLSFGVFLLY